MQPSSVPSGSGAKIPLIDDAKYPNIGDRLSAKGVSWNWYAGGWDDAVAATRVRNFQYHHQPFNYFANYAAGGPGRSHLQDEKNFIASAQNGTLPQVSFVGTCTPTARLPACGHAAGSCSSRVSGSSPAWAWRCSWLRSCPSERTRGHPPTAATAVEPLLQVRSLRRR